MPDPSDLPGLNESFRRAGQMGRQWNIFQGNRPGPILGAHDKARPFSLFSAESGEHLFAGETFGKTRFWVHRAELGVESRRGLSRKPTV